MNNHTVDTLVIGSGPGGYVAAIRAAQLKQKVCVVEKAELGGICLNWGCIPTKALLKNAEVFDLYKRSDEFGFKTGEVKFDFNKIIDRSRNVADQNSKGIQFLFKKNQIQHISGVAELKSKNEVLVKDKSGKITDTIKAKHIIIATGARPRSIAPIGLEIDEKQIWSYYGALKPPKMPKSMVIIGAGAIGVEFAYFYNMFGVKVDIVEMMDQLLPIEDNESVRHLERSYKKHKIGIHTSTKVVKVSKSAKGCTVEIEKKGKKESISADVVLAAVGIQANTENIGLEKIGVKLEKGLISVNPKTCQTSVDNIYAIGDCIGTAALAHVASAEGITVAEHIAGMEVHGVDYTNIPSCTYCQPQVASVGLTEKAALEKGYKLKIGRFPFSALGKARAIGETEGMVKLIFDEKYGELLGAHIVGHDATEMIAELGLAKTLETTFEEVARTVHAHPTLSEAVMEAAHDALGRAIHI
ncbi:MAG: dihydrolipoyl dehydrogenase [Calditrichaeota bacterium]|nr:dihydrolipoyl dehydrogenase [Calditrichota bacterium]